MNSALLKMSPDILTASGTYFNFLKPEESAFTIEDVAHALAHICRFTGHCREFYSVAQHSVLVSYHVPPEHRLAALLHDAAEAFVGDVASPLKQLLPEYRAIERGVEQVVLTRFGVDPVLPPCVKEADLRALLTERHYLMPYHDSDWDCTKGLHVFGERITPVAPPVAKAMFLRRYNEIRLFGDAKEGGEA